MGPIPPWMLNFVNLFFFFHFNSNNVYIYEW